jgi:Rrf2 family protein
MRLTAKTEYGLMCLAFMASQPDGEPVTIRQIVKGEGLSKAFTEKILQKLRSVGIVESIQGNQGGYVLSKKPEQISLREIVEALEGYTFDVFCEPKIRTEIVCNHFQFCGLQPIWVKTKDLLDHFFSSITLDQIACRGKHLPARGLTP